MILPIYAFGHAVLKSKCEDIDSSYEDLEELLKNMWETMYEASGVGLAAPQIGRKIRVFMVDTIQILEDDEKEKGIKQVFINAQKIEEEGDLWAYEEGCLSIPYIRADVNRPQTLRIAFLDENFEKQELTLEGINARVVQHEYDHIEGILFTDHLKPLKKKLLKRKLEAIKKGNVEPEYRMKFKVNR